MELYVYIFFFDLLIGESRLQTLSFGVPISRLKNLDKKGIYLN